MSHNCHAANASDGRGGLAGKVTNPAPLFFSPWERVRLQPMEHSQENHLLWLLQVRESSRTTCSPPHPQRLPAETHSQPMGGGHLLNLLLIAASRDLTSRRIGMVL